MTGEHLTCTYPLQVVEYDEAIWASGQQIGVVKVRTIRIDETWIEMKISGACEYVRSEWRAAIIVERQELLKIVRTLAPDAAKAVEDALAARVALSTLEQDSGPGAKP